MQSESLYKVIHTVYPAKIDRFHNVVLREPFTGIKILERVKTIFGHRWRLIRYYSKQKELPFEATIMKLEEVVAHLNKNQITREDIY